MEIEKLSEQEVDDFVQEGLEALNNAFANFITSKNKISVIPIPAHLNMLVEFVYKHIDVLGSFNEAGGGVPATEKIMIDFMATLIDCHKFYLEENYNDADE